MQSDLVLFLDGERDGAARKRVSAEMANRRNLPAPSFFPNHIIKPTYEEIESVTHRRRLGISFDILVFLKKYYLGGTGDSSNSTRNNLINSRVKQRKGKNGGNP